MYNFLSNSGKGWGERSKLPMVIPASFFYTHCCTSGLDEFSTGYAQSVGRAVMKIKRILELSPYPQS